MKVVYTKESLREWRAQQARLSASTASDASTAITTPSSSSSLPEQSSEPLGSQRKPWPVRKRRRLTQTCIDAGQRGLDWTACKKCGMQYVGGSAEDASRHKAACARIARAARAPPALNFAAWKDVYRTREDGLLLRRPNGDRVVAVGASFTHNLRRAEDVDAFVTGKLGIDSERLASIACPWLALVYVDGDAKRITGYALVQLVSGGRLARIGEDGCAVLIEGEKRVSRELLGVRRIWVAEACRRKSRASLLVDAARAAVVPGALFSRCRVAFTTPTQSGARFAVRYSNSAQGEGDKPRGALSAAAQSAVVIYDDSDIAAGPI